MKNYKLLFMAFALLVLASCSDDEPKIQNTQITGTWEMVGASCDNGNTTTEVNGIISSVDYEWVTANENAEMILNENPNEYFSTGSYTQVMSTYFGGVLFSEDSYDIGPFNLIGTWESTSTQFMMTYNGETQIADIVELTANTFKFKTELNDVESVGGGTITKTATINFEYGR